MADNKLTDAEIKKALECCKTGDCEKCPFYGTKEDCEVELPEEAINLINRKDAEIERLKAPKFLLENSLSEKEISKILKNSRVGVIPNIQYSVRRIDEDGIKAEAYKDLAEKLKAKKKRAYFESEGFYWCVLVDDIDAVLKEVREDV